MEDTKMPHFSSFLWSLWFQIFFFFFFFFLFGFSFYLLLSFQKRTDFLWKLLNQIYFRLFLLLCFQIVPVVRARLNQACKARLEYFENSACIYCSSAYVCILSQCVLEFESREEELRCGSIWLCSPSLHPLCQGLWTSFRNRAFCGQRLFSDI